MLVDEYERQGAASTGQPIGAGVDIHPNLPGPTRSLGPVILEEARNGERLYFLVP